MEISHAKESLLVGSVAKSRSKPKSKFSFSFPLIHRLICCYFEESSLNRRGASWLIFFALSICVLIFLFVISASFIYSLLSTPVQSLSRQRRAPEKIICIDWERADEQLFEHHELVELFNQFITQTDGDSATSRRVLIANIARITDTEASRIKGTVNSIMNRRGIVQGGQNADLAARTSLKTS